jgi:hypothetical protein
LPPTNKDSATLSSNVSDCLNVMFLMYCAIV